VIQVDHFQTGQINRNKSENIYYGGKGINVSWILQELGIQSTALGFIAGFTGKALQAGLIKQGIQTDFIEVEKGMTRINVKMKSDNETEINGIGPFIEETDFNKLIAKAKQLAKEDILVLSGSIPSCLPDTAYETLITCLDKDVKFVVDAEKGLLSKILKYKPFLIKPNKQELADLFKVELESEEQIVHYAKKLKEEGAINVLVSLAGDGAILVDENNRVHVRKAAKDAIVNSVGAGDSMVAGFLAGYLKKQDYGHALKLGTACGGATAFHSGLATKKQIETVFKALDSQ
jgi:1-phosphofructokinase